MPKGEPTDYERYRAEHWQAQTVLSDIENPDTPAGLDDESGDLLTDGRHVLRTAKTVVVTTWDGRTATEYPSESKAREAFKDATP